MAEGLHHPTGDESSLTAAGADKGRTKWYRDGGVWNRGGKEVFWGGRKAERVGGYGGGGLCFILTPNPGLKALHGLLSLALAI